MTTPVESECEDLNGAGQLVVDSIHRDAVEKVLAELKIQATEVGSAPAFDLTLLDLEHGPVPGHDDTQPVADLDPVLNEVRARFAGRCGGWVPLIGKNRQMNSVFGAYPQTKSHTLWDPKPVDRPSGWLTEHAGKGEGVRVGLLDTRIYEHEAIPGEAIEPMGFTLDKAPDSVFFEAGHGIFMAGLILNQAPAAKLVARAALKDDGKASAWCVVKQLEKFYLDEPKDRVQVLVLASGCRTHDGKAPLILERAIERLNRRMLVVAAAGNHGAMSGMSRDLQITRNSPTWPAALRDVVAVGLPTPFPDEDGEFERLDYSPDLPWVTCTVDPGPRGEFVSAYFKSTAVTLQSGAPLKGLKSGFVSWRGTSCAAAHLGGLIAAKMAEDEVDARTAFESLSRGSDSVAKPYEWEPEPQGATTPPRAATVGPKE
ncbi:S8/S53 family peptidase [Lentzea flava]|uniref:Peptidase S8/S53 domain-containing protein n=1 Tax=Lentzea flava TaxID=103732 RepID=A0ABQ2UHI7_9PSEU|nr:S8/S53 family peptidase [Lentzea flava]MCP2201035.1 Subtilase family protein [Lentzea flava]GGU27776.1 hypothetical protein GCM10010178_20040 [Lentzea flava]